MASFRIQGQTRLGGSIEPQGAKNEALEVICAVLLTSEEITISNIPHIRDVFKLIEIMESLGVKINRLNEHEYSFKADNIDLNVLDTEDFKDKCAQLRGSVMIIGPLLARFGEARMPKPGGDKIGRRRMDTHFYGFQKLGAQFNFDYKEDFFEIDASSLKGTYMMLDEASVTGTANIVMAASLAKGTTIIYNAACEPYVQQLCHLVNNMGGNIEGIGSNLLTIHGVDTLKGAKHRLLPDMIEIGSFIGMAAMTASDITITNAAVDQLGLIPMVFEKLGIHLDMKDDNIHIPAHQYYEIETFIDGSVLTVADAPWPGFTPDLLSIVLVMATQARGNVLIHQKMFESRLFFVDKLIDMGANVILCDPHRASVTGLNREKALKGITMTSPDIRAGVALLIAALSAEGESIIHNVEQIDRGYQYIDERLNKLGASIERFDYQ